MCARELTSFEKKVVWEMEGDLPSLACRAAIALDKLMQREQTDLDVVKRLVKMLGNYVKYSESGAPVPANGTGPSPLVTPKTLVIMKQAMYDSALAQNLTRVTQVREQVFEVASRLGKLVQEPPVSDNDNEELKQLRSFCLALSRQASAHKPMPFDQSVKHPYRR